jgi:CheY-like chemotaxis protein
MIVAMSAPGSDDRSGTRARRALLVDDNADAVDMLAIGLGDMGYEVVVAYDGPRALAAVEAFAPDGALVDLGLPGMNGLELGAALRARFGPGLRLVALTGYGHERERALTAAAGFDAHLVKPADLQTIARALGPNRL